jgi:predicted nucleic acid-binding protein
VIVLDTNVVSELMRTSPAVGVLSWLRQQQAADLFTTAVTLAEVRYGIARLPAGHRRDELTRTAHEVFGAFLDQILPFDSAAANLYADLVAARERGGSPINGFDAQIAAICLDHGAPLATRNGKDFRATGVDVIDPWGAAARS